MVTLSADTDSRWQAEAIQNFRQRTVPVVFIAGKHIGGCDQVVKLHEDNLLKDML